MGFFDFLKSKKTDPLRDHSIRIFKLSTEAGDATRKFMADSGETLSTEKWFAVVTEFQNLYLLITDRVVFGRIPDPKRSQVMNELCEISIDTSIGVICDGWGYERIKKIQAETMANYGKARADYGVCKSVVPEKGQSPAGTMLWEFAKTATGLVGHEMDIVYITFFMRIVDFKGLNAVAFAEAAQAQ